MAARNPNRRRRAVQTGAFGAVGALALATLVLPGASNAAAAEGPVRTIDLLGQTIVSSDLDLGDASVSATVPKGSSNCLAQSAVNMIYISDGISWATCTYPYTGAAAQRTYTFIPTRTMTVQYLVVGGGGQGGANSASYESAGGGGAGGGVKALLPNNPDEDPGITVTANLTYNVGVGKGGTNATQTAGQKGTDGGFSYFRRTGTGAFDITAAGGGGGGSGLTGNQDGNTGGSGGGGASGAVGDPGLGGAGGAGGAQGTDGGLGYADAGINPDPDSGVADMSTGAGGGGAGSLGEDAVQLTGGGGGDAFYTNVFAFGEITPPLPPDSLDYAAGGGGGSTSQQNGGTQGPGGGQGSGASGGRGANGSSAQVSGPNRGGGGGGGGLLATTLTRGGAGGNGTVGLRYHVFPDNPSSPPSTALVGTALFWTAPNYVPAGTTLSAYYIIYRVNGTTAWSTYARSTTATELTANLRNTAAAFTSANNANWVPLMENGGALGALVPGNTYDFAIFGRTATALGQIAATSGIVQYTAT